MAKLLELNITTGTLTTVLGTAGTNSGFTYYKGDRGLALKGVSGNTLTFTSVLTGVKTIVFAIKKATNTKLFLDNATDKLQILAGVLNGTGLTASYVNGISTTTVANSTYLLVIAEFSAGITFATNFKIAPTANVELPFKIVCYDVLLTEQERNKAQADFQNSFPIEKPSFDYQAFKASDLKNEAGLIAAYNMIPTGSVLTDISGNGNNGTISKAVSSKEGMVFNGKGNIAAAGMSATSTLTIAFRYKVGKIGIRQDLISNRDVAVDFISMQGSDNKLSFYVYKADGTGQDAVVLSTSTVSLNQWYNVIFIANGSTIAIYINGVLDCTPVAYLGTIRNDSLFTFIGTTDAAFSNPLFGTIADLRIYNRILSASEITSYHNQFAKRITLKEDMKTLGADSITF